MSDISIPGVTESKYKTDKIIEGLVKAKEVRLDQMEGDREKFELRRNIWSSINILTNKLETSSQSLYNIDSPFRQKLSSSSNESVLTLTSSRQADNVEYTVRVLQTAQADSLRSNEIADDLEVSSGSYRFGVGEEIKEFVFNGGTLKKFLSVANRQLRGLAEFNVVNSRGKKQVLVFTASKSGAENRLQFEGEGKQFALDVGLILDASSLQMDLLRKPLIGPFNELSDYSFSEGKKELGIAPGQELRISLPNSYSVRSGSVMRYEISSPRDSNLPPISNTPDNNTRELPPFREGAAPLRAQKETPRFSSRDARDIPTPPSAELEDIRVDSIGSDSAFIGINPIGDEESPSEQPSEPRIQEQRVEVQVSQYGGDLLNPTANIYFVQQSRRVAAGPKNGEVQATMLSHEEILQLNSISSLNSINEIVIRNPNPDREIIIKNLRFEDAEAKDDYVPTHPISRAQNAKISYLSVESERPSNQIDDLLPGLTLNLVRAKPEEDILIRTEPDYEAITEKIIEFVSNYNELMTQLNVVSSNNDAVIREKTSFTERQEEEARKVLGILRGDSNLNNLKYRLTQSVSEGYPTELGTRALADIGLSTNLNSFQGGIDQSKLRGYLEFDTDALQEELKTNFKVVQDLFGRDNDGDFIVDSGSAWGVQKIASSYTRPNGPIPYQVKDLERNITDNDRRISDYKDYLADYEQDLRIKYGRMEGALNQLSQQQESLKSFSDAMKR